MSNKQVSPGELAVGQYITILEWTPWEVADIDLDNPFSILGTKTKTHRDHSWCGDVLKVEAVDLPYIVVSHPNDGYLYGSNTKLDTRRVKLMELSEAYVKAAERRKS